MEWMMQERVDLARSQGLTRWPGQLMTPGDALAHRWVVTVTRDGAPVDLTGWTVMAYMTRQDGACVPVPGAAEGCAAGVSLPEACYACPGTLSGTLQASQGDVRITLAHGIWQVGPPSGATVVDPGTVVPSLQELLAEIAAMQAATDACEAATAEATAAIGDIPAIVSQAAPAIVAEASGALVSVTDGAARDAQGLVSAITAAQAGEGNPSPDNVRLITGWQAANLYHGAAYDESAAAALTATLPSTVYGGSLDWTTGTLTITHVMRTYDGTEDWTYGSANCVCSLKDLPDGVLVDNQSAYHKCSHYRPLRYRAGDVQTDKTCYTLNTTTLMVKDTSLTSLEDWTGYLAAQAAAGTPMTIVWALKEASYETIQLTPQQLTLLKGENHVWSDTGDTSVAYIADTRLYIDNAVAAIAASVINA